MGLPNALKPKPVCVYICHDACPEDLTMRDRQTHTHTHTDTNKKGQGGRDFATLEIQ